MEGRTESWLDAASAFQPFYANSKELLENNFKGGANRFSLFKQQMELPDERADVLKEILRNKESHVADLPSENEENGQVSGKTSPCYDNREFDRQSSTSSNDEDSDREEETEKECDGKKETNEVELKKARVENIITNIQHSPRSNGEAHNGVGSNELRRKKRKQNQPQQHESTVTENKYLKMDERNAVQQQLREMQQQLSCIQKRYSKLFDDAHSDEEFSCPLVVDVDSRPKTSSLQPQSPKAANKNDAPSIQLNVSQLTSVELHDLNKSLKSEIVAAVGSAIDTVVKKFIERAPEKAEPSKPAKESTPETKSPTPVPPQLTDLAKKPMHSPFERFEEARNRMRTKVSDKHLNNYFEHMAAARAYPLEVPLPFPRFFSPPSLYYPHTQVPLPQPLTHTPKAPEQTEALSLVCPPKKKRTKVTDTRLSPRAARALLQEPVPTRTADSAQHYPADMFPHSMQTSLPTSVAIPNPSLQHSDVLAMYSRGDFSIMNDSALSSLHHSPSMGERGSPGEARTPSDGISLSCYMKKEDDSSSNEGSCFTNAVGITSTLTPMHLRKAKLMFFYVRYPSSAVLKMYFPDILFNKNNTAQLVKWFSNFREFFYIQMEKYSRASMADGVQQAEELTVTTDSEIYRVLNLHYNRNNQLEIPDSFRAVVQLTLREFFKSISSGKDVEQSWKKQIYKVIARQDESVPEYFKSVNWMEQLAD